MQLPEKQELVRLLGLYQNELLMENEENLRKKMKSNESPKKVVTDYSYGVKAQYEHARIIIKKLSVEIGKEVKANWKCFFTLIQSFMLSPLHLLFNVVQLPCNPPDGTAVVQLPPPSALFFLAYAPPKRIAGHFHRAVKFVVHHFHTITTAVQTARHTLTNSQTSIA